MQQKNREITKEQEFINERLFETEDTSVLPTVSSSPMAEEAEERIIEEEAFEEDNETDDKFSFRQKWQIALVIFVSFFVFSMIFFPYQTILHYFFVKFSKDIPLTYEKIELRFFGNSSLKNVKFQPDRGTNVQVKRFDLGIPLLSFIDGSLEGTMAFSDLYFSSDKYSFFINRINILLNLNDFKLPIRQWRGEVNVRGEKLTELQVSQLANFGVDLDKMDIQSFDLKLSFEQGKLKFNNSQILSDYFTINLKGFVQLRNNFLASRLDGQLCIVPVADLEQKDSSLLSIYLIAGGKPGGELCLQLKGGLGNPKFERAPPDEPETNISTPNTFL